MLGFLSKPLSKTRDSKNNSQKTGTALVGIWAGPGPAPGLGEEEESDG